MWIRRQLEPYEESVVLHIRRDTIILINCKPPVDMRHFRQSRKFSRISTGGLQLTPTLIGYNWPNETKLLRGVPILVERCEFISKMFSFVFAWRPKVLEICIEKIHFLRKKWEFFQKSPLFPAIFPIFAKIPYFPSGVTVWKRRPPTVPSRTPARTELWGPGISVCTRLQTNRLESI